METSTQQGFNGSYVGINKTAHRIHSKSDNGHPGTHTHIERIAASRYQRETIVILFMSRGFSVYGAIEWPPEQKRSLGNVLSVRAVIHTYNMYRQ